MTRALADTDLFALALPSDPQLSPDGQLAAWVVTTVDEEKDGYQHRIWAGPTDGSEPPRQLTAGPTDGAPCFTPDGQSLLFLAARGGAPQVYLLPLTGGEARSVTSAEHGVAGFQLSPDGSQLALTCFVPADDTADTAPVVVDRLGYKADGIGLLRGREARLFLTDLAGAEPRPLTAPGRSWSTPRWSPDGQTLAAAAAPAGETDREVAQVVHLLAAQHAADVPEPRPVTPAAEAWDVFDWARDGDRLLLVGSGPDRGGMNRLATVATDGGSVPELLDSEDRNVMTGGPAYPGARPRFTTAGILFCLRDRGATVACQLDPTSGKVERLTQPSASVSGLAESGGAILATIADPTTPGEVVLLPDRQLTRLFAAALPEVELVRPVDREFPAPDGRLVHGWVLRADSTTGPAPTLLDIHGGPHNAWGPSFDGVHLYHQVLADRGWNVVYVNPRASDGYGDDWWNTNRGSWGLGDEADFHAALDALVADGTADPARLAVTGYSYGGYMTCWLSARSDRFAAAVPGGAIVGCESSAGTSDVGHFLARYEYGSDSWEQPERFRQQSPINYVSAVQTPTLILHGESDDRCPVSEAEQWFMALRLRGVPVRLVRYPGGSHLFIVSGRPSHRLDYGRRLVDWVAEHTATAG